MKWKFSRSFLVRWCKKVEAIFNIVLCFTFFVRHCPDEASHSESVGSVLFCLLNPTPSPQLHRVFFDRFQVPPFGPPSLLPGCSKCQHHFPMKPASPLRDLSNVSAGYNVYDLCVSITSKNESVCSNSSPVFQSFARKSRRWYFNALFTIVWMQFAK